MMISLGFLAAARYLYTTFHYANSNARALISVASFSQCTSLERAREGRFQGGEVLNRQHCANFHDHRARVVHILPSVPRATGLRVHERWRRGRRGCTPVAPPRLLPPHEQRSTGSFGLGLHPISRFRVALLVLVFNILLLKLKGKRNVEQVWQSEQDGKVWWCMLILDAIIWLEFLLEFCLVMSSIYM